LGQKVIDIMPKVIADLPDPKVASSSWRDYGEIDLCGNREKLAEINLSLSDIRRICLL
jgi:sulfopropanediol 3-dehydrogenase